MNYGVAIPFSTDGPSMFESQQSDSMEAFLYKSGAIYETSEGERMRFDVIDKLRLMVCNWATEVGVAKSMTPNLNMVITSGA